VEQEKKEPAPGQEPAAPPEAAELLQEMRLLRRRARVARHAYWFPLVLFGVLICASAPFYIQPSVHAGYGQVAGVAGPSMPLLGGFSDVLVSSYLGYYWLTALFAGLLLTLLWYRRNARRVGLATPARGYIITGIYTAAALLASLYNVENVLFRLGWNPSPNQWRLTSLPGVLLPALVLLVAGVSALAGQRRHRVAR
jgi:hypothetical protein